MTTETDEVVVFMVSRHTNTPYRRVLWRMTRADAKKVCSDDRTGGARHMLCWTAVDIDDATINHCVPDNGRYDALLRELGVTVLRRRAATAGPIAAGPIAA
jgi:hypothetical protein